MNDVCTQSCAHTFPWIASPHQAQQGRAMPYRAPQSIAPTRGPMIRLWLRGVYYLLFIIEVFRGDFVDGIGPIERSGELGGIDRDHPRPSRIAPHRPCLPPYSSLCLPLPFSIRILFIMENCLSLVVVSPPTRPPPAASPRYFPSNITHQPSLLRHKTTSQHSYSAGRPCSRTTPQRIGSTLNSFRTFLAPIGPLAPSPGNHETAPTHHLRDKQ